MQTTTFDANLEQDVLEALRRITLVDEAEGDSATFATEPLDDADPSRSIDAYRPPLPEFPISAAEEEDAQDDPGAGFA